MSSTTSRWINSSWLNASSSCVKLTVPSIEFSIATNPKSTSPTLDGIEHIGHGAVQQVLRISEIGLRLQCLLGERAEWPEEADASCWTNHVSQAIGLRSFHGAI